MKNSIEKIGAGYIRVSTDDQTEYSPTSQIKLIKKYAKENNITLLNDYIFQEDGI
ncbi:MAG: recombinase family protein, partial [Bacilli bacterium]|nr:recombinase family protein [Bacilli bacterium]